MALVIETMTRVYWENNPKLKWDIAPHDKVRVGDVTYVKLYRKSNSQLSKLVFHECPFLPHPLPDGYSLTTSTGYAELMKIRSEQQAHELRSMDDEPMP